MVRNIPKSEMNHEFKKELRQKIISKIHSQNKYRYSFNFPIFASICVSVFVSLLSWNYIQDMNRGGNMASMISFVPHIERVWPNAFRWFSQSDDSNTLKKEWWRNMQMIATSKMNNDIATTEYEPIRYQYSYSGTLPSIDWQLLVYKKNLSLSTSQDTASLLENLHIEGIDTRAFQNAKISNLNISEDREYGYTIWIDFVAGNINFSQNYLKWPQPKCDINGCETQPKLAKSDIPSDIKLIDMTDAFIKKYWINRTVYWLPRIDTGWKNAFARSIEEWAEWIIPDMLTITYPVILGDKNLYEEFGGYRWLTFNIDIRSMRITSVSWLERYNLESSEYPHMSDEKIRKLIATWGKNIEENNSWKTIQLNLKDPTIGYVRFTREWEKGIMNEFYIPAYIFTVENMPKDSYISDTVIVPIVEWFSDNKNPL